MIRHTIQFNRPLRDARLVRVFQSGGSAADSSRIINPVDLGRRDATNPDFPSTPQPGESSVLLENIRNLLADISLKLDELTTRQSHSLRDLQEFAVRMAVVIASLVVCDEVKSNDARIRALIETALDQIPERAEVVIRLNSIDLDRMKSSAFWETRSGQESLKWVADANMPIGDCRVDAEQLRMVASLEEQLTRMEKRLMETLDHAQIERRGVGSVNSRLGRVPDRRGIA